MSDKVQEQTTSRDSHWSGSQETGGVPSRRETSRIIEQQYIPRIIYIFDFNYKHILSQENKVNCKLQQFIFQYMDLENIDGKSTFHLDCDPYIFLTEGCST